MFFASKVLIRQFRFPLSNASFVVFKSVAVCSIVENQRLIGKNSSLKIVSTL